MQRFILSSLCLLAVGLVNVEHVTGACNKVDGYDYLTLTLQWAPSICSAKSCRKPSKTGQWTVHGLWPSYARQQPPTNCCHQEPKLNPSKLPTSDLAKIWPNVLSGNDESFWNYEWSKHGTCAKAAAPKLATQSSYFQNIVQLVKSHPIDQYLAKGGVKPGSGTYEKIKIHRAIEGAIGKRVYIDCEKTNGAPVLSQLYICLDPKTLKPVDCRKSDNWDCGKQDGDKIAYPSA